MPSGTPHNPNVKHLFIVCTEVLKDGTVVLASVSSWKNDLCDQTCKLEIGCHEFITKESFILYRKSRIEPSNVVENGIKRGIFIQKNDVEPEILARIVDGITQSNQTPWQIKRAVRKA